MRAGQAIPHALGVGDLIGAHVDLDVPAEVVHAPGERLDHVERRRRRSRIELGEPDAANAAVREGFQLRVRDRGMDHDDAARVAELRDGIERDAVVGAVGRGRDHHGSCGPDALLQQPIVRHAGVRLHPQFRPRRRKALAVVDVHVAVAGIGRRGELRRRVPDEFGTGSGTSARLRVSNARLYSASIANRVRCACRT